MSHESFRSSHFELPFRGARQNSQGGQQGVLTALSYARVVPESSRGGRTFYFSLYFSGTSDPQSRAWHCPLVSQCSKMPCGFRQGSVGAYGRTCGQAPAWDQRSCSQSGHQASFRLYASFFRVSGLVSDSARFARTATRSGPRHAQRRAYYPSSLRSLATDQICRVLALRRASGSQPAHL